MIDESVLEELFHEIGDYLAVPDDGAARVVAELGTTRSETRRPSKGATRLLLAAAVLVVFAALALMMHGFGGSTSVNRADAPAASKALSVPETGAARVAATPLVGQHGAKGVNGATGAQGVSPVGPAQGLQGDEGIQGPIGNPGVQGAQGGVGGVALAGPVNAAASDGVAQSKKAKSTGETTAATAPTQSPTAPIDGAIIVKTGSLDLQVKPKTLRPTFNRVTSTVVGLGGYVANQSANYSGDDPTGIITVRVPVNRFEQAVSQINALPGVTVLNDSESGKDVTAQYVNVQAQITADTIEVQSLQVVLSHTTDLNDILNLRNQITSVQSTIDQLQGQNNLLTREAQYSAISITATESLPPGHKAHTAHPAAKTGLAKSWSDASSGFATSTEWFIARSGGALILFLVALLLIFGLRYFYPVLRRALL